MIRVHIICEGSTEERFVTELLGLHMQKKQIIVCPARIGKPGHKGGNIKFLRLLLDAKLRLLGDSNCFCTTLLDYYGLPTDFPGKAATNAVLNSQSKFELITKALQEEMVESLGERAANRFIPYVQMHEFEGLLFSQTDTLALSIQKPELKEKLASIRAKYATPEDINDSPHTAPSKRIETLFPGYDKPIHPLIAAQDIGLDTIRRECPLFDGWIKRLESLASRGV